MSEVLAGAGVLAAAGSSAATVLLPRGPLRVAAMLAALALFPVLILGDQWHTAQISDLREDSARIVALAAIAAAAIAALGLAFYRWPRLLPLAIVFALPFRIPLHAGGDTANLLVPLYLVIGGGVLAAALRVWAPETFARRLGPGGQPTRPEPSAVDTPVPPAGGAVGGPAPEEALATAGGGGSPAATGPAGRTAASLLPKVLAAFVVLYALQSLYSEDFSKALQSTCFFLVPFTIAYALIRDLEWDRRLLTWVLVVLAVEAVAFVAVGTVEYATRELFWNDQVIRSNEFHTYFRVNSVFWDPNVYGRYLALVVVVATAVLLWARERRDLALLTALVAVLWFGLVQTFSESSYIALLGGLAVLAALRWNWRWTLAAAAVALFVLVGIVGASGKLRLNVIFSGRADLVAGGLELASERPLWGYGSGAFEAAYRDHRDKDDTPVSASHTEPVTVLAEQGLIGFAAYTALVVVAILTMASGIRAGPAAAVGPAARPAVLAAFVALLVHTMSYAGFFEDPITWVLLALGASLAARAGPAAASGEKHDRRAAIRGPA